MKVDRLLTSGWVSLDPALDDGALNNMFAHRVNEES
jgi:hypothetical protein